MMLSVIIPTRTVAVDLPGLVRRTAAACHGLDAELVFVDDSTDLTLEAISREADLAAMPVRVISRVAPSGGPGGAAAEGIASSGAEFCVVMQGDLQHPPEVIPALMAQFEGSGADVVVASRSRGPAGDAAGRFRSCASFAARRLTLALFPLKLNGCADPLSGFFAVRRAAVDPEVLRPGGCNLLLEILARHRLTTRDVPFAGTGMTGAATTGLRAGLSFARQLGGLRAGTAVLFALVGAVGAVMNLLIMALLHQAGAHYAVAAAVAAELTILSNFLMQEKIVFGSLRNKANGFRKRFAQSFGFNNLDALLRLPVLFLAVDVFLIDPIAAQAVTLLAAFVLRYLFHSRIVYAAAAGTESAGLRRPDGAMIRKKVPQGTP